MSHIDDFIRREVKKQGITMLRVAEASGMTALYRSLKNETISAVAAVKIAALLKVPIADLLGADESALRPDGNKEKELRAEIEALKRKVLSLESQLSDCKTDKEVFRLLAAPPKIPK